jgi:hypothetical protein
MMNPDSEDAFTYEISVKHEGQLPAWCPVESFLAQMHNSESSARKAQRRNALVAGCLQKASSGDEDAEEKISNLRAWGSERVARAVSFYQRVRLQEFCRTELPDFTDALVVVSFGARDGGFQLSQDLRTWMLGYLGWPQSAIYHDYASLVGHPLSVIEKGADGVTRQLNPNWNLYFHNALTAAPVMVFVVSEAWTQSAWCALELRQRVETKVAKQTPAGVASYRSSAHSNPAHAMHVPPVPSDEAGEAAAQLGAESASADPATAAANAYLARYGEMAEQLEEVRVGWQRSQRSFAEATEGVFRAVAFGSKKNELYLFVDDPFPAAAESTAKASESASPGTATSELPDSSAASQAASPSAALRAVHDSVPEHQRFYHLPSMSNTAKALELHALCVRLGEVIEEQGNVEAFGSGQALLQMILSGTTVERSEGGNECTVSLDFGCSGSDDGGSNGSNGGGRGGSGGSHGSGCSACVGVSSDNNSHVSGVSRGFGSSLRGLRELADADARRQEAEVQRAQEARLDAGKRSAIERGLLFDTGPCPF